MAFLSLSPQKRRLILIGISLLLVAGGIAYWLDARKYETTENAYINADIVQIAAQVSGRIIELAVHENQYVHKGDLLFVVDEEPAKIGMAMAQNFLEQARQHAFQNNSDVTAKEALLRQQRADLANAQKQLARDEELARKHFMSQQAADNDRTRVRTLQAAADEAQANLEKAQNAALGGVENAPTVRSAEAQVAAAKLFLDRSRVYAPQDGWLSNLRLAVGTNVTSNTPLFALIVDRSFWVDANFKETQLENIHVGQPVDVEVDMYSGHTYQGRVDSLSGGTGTAFSLLPAQNATGNWVKITQRVPVRVKVNLRTEDADYPLRVGASAHVSVHVR